MPNLVPVANTFLQTENVSPATYTAWYTQSLQEPTVFWAEQAKRLTWITPFHKVYEGDFAQGDNRWFVGGQLNVSANCLDRHLAAHADKPALIWQGENDNETRTYTFKTLYEEVCRFANVLRKQGLQKGDSVILYLPMVPELAIALLACTRLGIVHSVVFAGFSANALANRIADCQPKLVITAETGLRAGQHIPIKETVDQALALSQHIIDALIVVHRTPTTAQAGPKEYFWHTLMADPTLTHDCEPVACESEDPLFILYTSGSTGKAKGIIHTTAGYLLGAHLSFWSIFDPKPTDIHWCTADIGWITGHSYVLYGPLSNGITTFMYEGTPTYPHVARWWELIDRYQITIFYTAPTAIRLLQREGDAYLAPYSLASLRVLGSVGEPINPAAWLWFYEKIGKESCPIADTWWQTETGSILLSPLPGAIALKPGSAMLPFFGAAFALLDEAGNCVEGPATGYLCLTQPWPSMMRGIMDKEQGFHGAQQRFHDKYLQQFPGYYLTGDKAIRDAQGDYWIVGRSDDVINVSGHRLGSAEIESALVEHPGIAEASVVSFPHPIKGEGIYAFVLPLKEYPIDAQLKQELCDLVAKEIGKFAKPDIIQFTTALPKTRSGKIMRRILRAVATEEWENLGDTSTLADPFVIEELKKTRPKK